ncbi:MAG: Fe-S cluster assembly scaffold protein NifU [Desulfarculus sp.]|jgi:nitrogen fixation NifU-like protein|nr:MAG: Fe-S cluster assembly scaffold protein NifU [Desulfarculus sp.]
MYSELVKDHFMHPRNVGEIPEPDGKGEVGNPVCGDMMTVYIKVKDDAIADVKFKTFGCGAAIAVSSMVTEMAKGKPLAEAMKISNRDVAQALGGLPKNKLHCSNLGADALHMAIQDYLDRKAGKPPKEKNAEQELAGMHLEPGHAHAHAKGEKCYCPYCDIEVPSEAPFCTNCGQEIPPEH